jgi:hypothetical protein
VSHAALKNFIAFLGPVAFGLALSSANAQTVVNNGSNNTTNVIVQRAPVVVIVRGQPERTKLPEVRPAPTSFPYQQQELLPYMAPRCSQLFEMQMGGKVRRVSPSSGGDVREEFRLNCSDAVSSAQKALYQVKLKAYLAREDVATEQRVAANQSKASREQCDELLRILAAKRKRLPTMTDGERGDHQRAESNHQARCTAG